MTPEFGQLPSLWKAAARVSEAFSVPKLVIISFPNPSLAKPWKEVFLPTVLEYLRIKEEVEESIDVSFDASSEDPLCKMGEALEMEFGGLDEFLYPTHGEPIVVLHWEAAQALPASWQEFLRLFISQMEHSDQTIPFRKLMILNEGNGEFPEFLEGSPSVEHLQLWNAITWEELRLYAGSLVEDEPNDIRKAWMISTYSGASNFDLRVLMHLCDERPMSIEGTLAEAQSVLSEDPTHSVRQAFLLDKHFGREWRPPASMLNAWFSGATIGATIERGFVRPWNSYSPTERSSIANHLIWKEQVSGLFPLLIELGRELNERILEKYGEEFSGTVAPTIEPSEMLAAIRQVDCWLPQNIYEGLKKLRDARNQLAHLEPLERRDLEAIWDTQLRIRAGQY